MDPDSTYKERWVEESLAGLHPSEDDDDYALLEKQYQRFLDARQQAFQQTRYIYENLDKWLLSLSGAGVAFATGSVVFGSGSPMPIAIWAAVSFAVAIVVALFSKALTYNRSREFSLETDIVWERFPRTFDAEHRRMSESMLPRHDKLTVKLNTICFLAFIVGIVLIICSAFAKSSAASSLQMKDQNASRRTPIAESSSASPFSTDAENTNHP